MARLLYWCVYNLDLGPAGPTTLKLALRTWHAHAKRRAYLEPFLDWRSRDFSSQPGSVKINQPAL